MWLPGLMVCELMIQPARFPGVFGKIPEAIVVRLARWVRSGPTCPEALVPSMV